MAKETKVMGIVYDPEKQRFDRNASHTQFEAFLFTSKELDTVIHLLSTTEDDLVLRVLQHLDQFVMSFIGYYEVLYQKEIVPKLLQHMDSGTREVSRFAWKLMSQMFYVREAQPKILVMDRVFEMAYNNFIESEDEYLVEYSAIVLNHFVNSLPHHLEAVLNPSILSTTLKRIASTRDPDVRLHSLKLLVVIWSKPKGLALMCHDNTVFMLLEMLIYDEYSAPQTAALQALLYLTKCTHCRVIQGFENPAFIEKVFGILEKDRLKHLHLKTFELLRLVLHQPNVAKAFIKGSNIKRLMDLIKLKENYMNEAMPVLLVLANSNDAKPILQKLGLTEMLTKCHMNSDIEQAGNVKLGMANFPDSMDTFVRDNSVEIHVEVLGDTNKSENSKKTAVMCLAKFIDQSEEAAVQALKAGAMDHIANLLKGVVNIDLRWLVIKLLASFAQFNSLKKLIMSESMAGGLLVTLQSSLNCNIFLNEVLSCMSLYLSEEPIQELILTGYVSSILNNCLIASNTIPMIVRLSAVNFIISCAPYPLITDKFITAGILKCLTDDSEAMENIPNWSRAIDVLLKNNLPIKFASLGIVEVSDITTGIFYVTKHIWTEPQTLHDIVINMLAPLRPIILVNFNVPKSFLDDQTAENNEEIPTNFSRKASEPRSSTLTIAFDFQPADPELIDYLQEIKTALKISEIAVQPNTVEHHRNCVEILSDFVCTKINVLGCDSYDKSSLYTTSISSVNDKLGELDNAVYSHLRDLRQDKFNLNIFSLGSIRVGGYLERSLLFKVIADRIGLPCSLRMDLVENRLVWNEVAFDICDEERSPIPTHIVDLMETPGNLYAIGSKLAQKYLAINRDTSQ